MKKFIAKELIKIAKSLISTDWVLDHGEFSKDSNIFFHAFKNTEYLIKALEDGKFGRSGMTSIGIKGSNVPYSNEIWFKPKNIQLLPVFYYDGSTMFSELKEEIANRFGIEVWQAQVNQKQYEREQEWYYNAPIDLKSIDIRMVTYRRSATPEQLQRLKTLSQQIGFSYIPYPWQ